MIVEICLSSVAYVVCVQGSVQMIFTTYYKDFNEYSLILSYNCLLIEYCLILCVVIDVQTDGKWCYLIFWVVGKPTTKWNLLKNRLLEVCPTCTPSASGIFYFIPEFQQPRPPEIYLLKFWCSYGRKGLLHGTSHSVKKLRIVLNRDFLIIECFVIKDTFPPPLIISGG